MAINSTLCGDVKSTKSTGSSDSYSKPFYGNGLKGSNCAACSATKYRKKKNSDSKSPYLNGDNVPSMIPSLIEKNFTSKKGSNIVSSFPLAVNIYKANSGEFRHLKSANRKPKKSVLTLPNLPAPLPQTCTVSDMNDSEYFNKDDERKKIKKRNPTTRNRKTKYEFYDMNAKYRSQMNTDLDVDLSSSSDLIQSCIDGKRLRKPKLRESKHGDQTVPHDVWAILRNINRFQFRPSPPMSDESFPMPKKRKGRKKRQKDVRVVETEEFAYITSSYDIESKSQRSQSKSSSFDRITVIDKEHEFSQLCKAFERRFSRSNNLPKCTSKQHQIRNQNKAIAYNTNKNSPKQYLKNVIQKFNTNQTINNKPLGYEYNEKKLCNNNCGDINGSKLQYNVSSNNTLCNDGDFDDSVDTFSNGFGEDIDQDFIYSGNSGSSNTAGPVKGSRYEGKRGQGSSICRSSDHYKPLEGKAKVDLNRDQKRNRQTTPRSDQKLTQTEIRRRIARMKFPIVVLGQDQLSSNFEVVSAEPLHFNGLKTHIWPFMRQWQNINSNQNVIKDTFNAKTDSSLQRKRSNTKTDSGLQKKKYSQPFLNSNKLASNKLELKYTNRGMITQKSVNSDKAATDSKIKDSSGELKLVKTAKRTISPQKKPTSVYMLKQKMMELLYNNIPNQSLANETKAITKQSDVKTKLISKITYDRDATPVKRGWVKSKEVPRNPINSPVKTSKQGFTSKKPFGKPSWASELIDNVIKKIKNGVYYTHDPSKLINRKREIKVKEVEVQTIATGIDKSNSIMQSISKVTITKKSLGRVNLPGFDDSKLPAIEIQTLNSSEILVKHCVTNILVHFDITTPLEPILNVPKSMALIPLEGGQRKAYKCKTSIINSMLPAEICTILPKMMSSFSVEPSIGLLNPRNSLDKSPTLLSTISEIHTESADTLRQLPFLLHLKMAVKHQELLNGFSFRKTIRKRNNYVNTPKLSYSKPLEIEMLPILSRNHLLNYSLMDPFHKIMLEKRAKNPFYQKPVNTCVTIQTYSASNSLNAFRRFDLNSFLKSILSNTQRKPFIFPHVLNYLIDKNITINLTTINSQGLEDLIRLNIRSLVTDINNIRSLVTGINKRKSMNATENIGIIQRDLFAIEYTELKQPVLNKNSSTESSKGGNKTKKKGYQKLYRKCQSTSNISIRRTTSMSKITNIDVFFQALGLAPELTAVFDKTYCTKIMSSLKEISNWISDINPTQALLVLLLTNKKDTPDLLRFRPVILQGIAVKRITRANELDMEIEVIEREQMNVGRQYEGISYLPASPENQDSLFEELCWIAKTTASDYQTIFDESSRRLLKSLLEKRKKLNPSYLRVMARYVGLGLLKTPRKTTI